MVNDFNAEGIAVFALHHVLTAAGCFSRLKNWLLPPALAAALRSCVKVILASFRADSRVPRLTAERGMVPSTVTPFPSRSLYVSQPLRAKPLNKAASKNSPGTRKPAGLLSP
ncbi:MAG: hypothetical protein HC888_11800 [Candidatus Competibacteraceae bacterium]|nr:hypothetical protein [Candidatus Competibacteraceae bacterium]